jgi:Prolyl oligopeptidase family
MSDDKLIIKDTSAFHQLSISSNNGGIYINRFAYVTNEIFKLENDTLRMLKTELNSRPLLWFYHNDEYFIRSNHLDSTYRLYTFADGKYEDLFPDIRFKHILYWQNQNLKFLIYDSLSITKAVIYNLNDDDSKVIEIGYLNYEKSTFSDSTLQLSFKSLFKNYSLTINNDLEITGSSYQFSETYNDTIIKVNTGGNDYVIYQYLYNRKNGMISDNLLMYTYGGYNLKKLQYSVSKYDTLFLDNGIGIIRTSISGDGDISWKKHLNGIGYKIENSIEDLKFIVDDIKKNKFTNGALVGNTGSYGSKIMLSTSMKYPNLFDAIHLASGEYNYYMSVSNFPTRHYLLGAVSDKRNREVHDKLDLENIIKPTKTKYLLTVHEYDSNVENSSTLELVYLMNKHNVNYILNYQKNVSHIQYSGYNNSLENTRLIMDFLIGNMVF